MKKTIEFLFRLKMNIKKIFIIILTFFLQKTALESHRRPRNALDKDIEEVIRSEIIPLNPSDETGRK